MVAPSRQVQKSRTLRQRWSVVSIRVPTHVRFSDSATAGFPDRVRAMPPLGYAHRMDTIKTLVTTQATVVGGRNGHAESNDGVIKVDLSVAKEMGGPGKPGTTTPEHLFSAGYAACFGGALDFVGKQHKKDASKARITCSTSVGPRDKGGYGISVKMKV